MHWLMNALEDRVAKINRATLMHGDCGLYNLIIDETKPNVSAILDWELSTLCDALVDLAHHIRPWWLIPDATTAAPTLIESNLMALGIPDMETHIDNYFAAANQTRAGDWSFYLAFVRFRYAAMIQGILKRKSDGTVTSRTVPYSEARIAEIATEARQFLMASK